jgi:hypothetical protein
MIGREHGSVLMSTESSSQESLTPRNVGGCRCVKGTAVMRKIGSARMESITARRVAKMEYA